MANSPLDGSPCDGTMGRRQRLSGPGRSVVSIGGEFDILLNGF
jgi:hypothetical protein